MKNIPNWLLIALPIALFVVVAALAAAGLFGRGIPAPARAKAALPANLHTIAQQAKTRGMNRCLARINALATELTAGVDYGAYAIAHDDDADAHLYSIVITRERPGGGAQLVTLEVAPDQACSASIGISTVWRESCDKIVPQLFASYKQKSKMPGDIMLAEAGPLRQLFIMPLPKGCATLRKDRLN